MVWRMKWLVVVAFLVWAAVTVRADGPAGTFSDELGTAMYDCQLTLTPAKTLSTKAALVLLLDWKDPKNYTRLTLTRKTLVIEAIAGGKVREIGQLDPGVNVEEAYHLVIMRRGNALGVLHDEALLFRGEAPRPNGGTQAGVTADAGWTVEDSRIQRIEPVAFADNFMRAADEPGQWTKVNGSWGLQSAWDEDPHGNENRFINAPSAQNPFAWVGRNPAGSALCTAGTPNWEDYSFTVAIRPPVTGAAGVMVNMADARHGLLLRWSPITDRSPQGNTLCLYRIDGDERTLLASTPGGYVPRQWCKLTVVSDPGTIRVLVDGRERLTAEHVTPWRGGIGLYAEGAEGAVFDDVTVYGRLLNTDLIDEFQQVRISQRILDDPNTMRQWNSDKIDWHSLPGVGTECINRREVFGDQRLSLVLKPNTGKIGKLWLALNSDGKAAYTGYRVTIEPAAEGTKTTYSLYRGAVQLTTKSVEALKPGESYRLRFWHEGKRIWLDVDGKRVIEATVDQPLDGLHPAYYAEGCYMGVSDAVVLGRNVLDYAYAEAPVDWVGDGTWMSTSRWACSPQWSFLGGWSRGDAILWHKARFTGDQSFEAFVGPKMEYPREKTVYMEHYRNFSITICGDGRDPRTGYTGIYSFYTEGDGLVGKKTVLLRNGVEVASKPCVLAGWPTDHRSWFGLLLRKKGNTIEFSLDGDAQPLTFTDPAPIDGGVPAVWTTNNSIIVARTRLHYANAPQWRADTQVTIDAPWYPEWLNVGETTTLDFPHSCSTSGKPVSLRVTPHQAPSGESAPAVDGMRLSFTPKFSGEHWYRVNAGDGEADSPSFHFTAPVFNPALGRDDSHALLLYRFNEGQGRTIKDYSPLAPATDLSITDTAATQWLPGQGLTFNGGTPLMTMRTAGKLMAIAKTNACTIELWISTDTMYPPPFGTWSGTLLSWDAGSAPRNFIFWQNGNRLIFTPQGGAMTVNGGGSFTTDQIFRTSLHHWVLTWDGTVTRIYMDGELKEEKTIAWNTTQWKADAMLFLGNLVDDNKRGFRGAYYLTAIHDRCFTLEQIKRHNAAGPSGK
ncbi:MAG: LamG domain-containing protein [Armatimonadota bacterium]